MTSATLLPAARPAASPAPAATTAPASWDLTPLYPDDAACRAAKDRIVAALPKVKAYQGRLGESAATLREAMDLIYGLRKDLDRIGVYCGLKRDVNTRDSAALELYHRYERRLPERVARLYRTARRELKRDRPRWVDGTPRLQFEVRAPPGGLP